jgi:Tfp pilus assembly protein PilN
MESDPLIAANARLDEEAALLQKENEELRQILARKRDLVERLRVIEAYGAFCMNRCADGAAD